MNDIDLKIIELLRCNSRMTSSEISKKVNLSIPAVAERMRKLEEGSIISKYTIKLNREKFNMDLLAFVFIHIDKTDYISKFKEIILMCHDVLECHHIAGEYDYLIKVAVKDTRCLEEFISYTLKKIPGVAKTNTIIALSTVKEEI
jgi:Lrp/AsnC family transcriptional regulator, leucine-responsive regulatory protein